MHCASRWLFAVRCLLLAALVAVLAVSPAWAKSKKKKKGNSSAKAMKAARIDYLQRFIAAEKDDAEEAADKKATFEAKMARLHAELGAAQSNLSGGKSVVEQKSGEASALRRTLESIERRIRQSQESGSIYKMLEHSLADAREKLEQARKSVLESSDYNARFAGASSLAAAARSFGKTQADALKNDAAYQRAQLELRAAETLFNQHKTELFLQDGEWMNTIAALRQLLPQIAEDKELKDAAARKVSGVKISLRSVTGLASDAEEEIQKSKAAITAAASELSKLAKSKDDKKDHDKKSSSDDKKKKSESSNSSSSSGDKKAKPKK